MWDVFLKTVPFFAIIGLGYASGRTKFFSAEATAYLTKFVFYFALSAMLFRFAATLDMAEVLDWNFIAAYFSATLVVYILATLVSYGRGRNTAEAAFEAQCSVIGNVGFLGIPMLSLLMGPAAIAQIIIVLSVDLIVFGSLIVILVTGSRDQALSLRVFRTVTLGLAKNPMIVSVVLGLLWSRYDLPVPLPVEEFLTILGAAATPGALFAIGASLATAATTRLSDAALISVFKLLIHPAAVAVTALWLFPVEPYAAGVMIAAAALPVAGNVYILAEHYRVAPTRVSASILVSTAVSILTVSAVITYVTTL